MYLEFRDLEHYLLPSLPSPKLPHNGLIPSRTEDDDGLTGTGRVFFGAITGTGRVFFGPNPHS